MKLLTLSAVLSVIQAVNAGDPACHPPAASCRLVSPRSARECSSIIHSRHIRLSTCEAPAGTITKTITVTVHPTSTHTKTVKPTSTKTSTRTITITDPATRRDTTTVLATVTSLLITTTVKSEFSTATATTTSVETDFTTTTFTTTHDSTSTVSWAPETCSQVPFKRSGKYPGNDIPRDCLCFMTTTKSCGPHSTRVITSTKQDHTKTITKTVSDRNRETVTTIKITTTHVNGALPSKQTVTSTATSFLTTTATSISTVEQITTATEVTTTTVVQTSTVSTGSLVMQTEDPCSGVNVNKYLVQGVPSNPNVVLGFQTDGNNNPGGCCTNCHQNFDCVFWRLSQGGSLCEGYFTNRNVPVQGCSSNTCRRGHPVMLVSPGSDGSTYGMGQCGQFVTVT